VTTASGIDPGFTAHRGIGPRPSLVRLLSVQASRAISDQLPSCVRLPSLADDASGTLSLRVPRDGTSLLWVPVSGEGGLDAGKVPAPGIGAAPVYSPSVFGAHPYTADPARAAQLTGHPTTAPPDFPVPPLRFLSTASDPATTDSSRPIAPPTSPANSSRGAVTCVTSHAGAIATPSAASGLTANAAHNAPPSAGSGVARLADLPASFAVSVWSTATASGTTAHTPSLAIPPGAPA